MKKIFFSLFFCFFFSKTAHLLAQSVNANDSLIVHKLFSPPNSFVGWDAKKNIKDWKGVGLAFKSSAGKSEYRVDAVEFSGAFTGTILKDIEGLEELRTLRLKHNGILNLPMELGKLKVLNELIIESDNLSGSIPSEVGLLSNLENLKILSKSLSGGIPKEIGNLKKLYSLTLNGIGLTGELPLEIGNFTNLQTLILGNLKDVQSINLIEIKKLKKLSRLYIFNSFKSMTQLPIEIGEIKSLRDLSIGSMQINGGLKNVLAQLDSLEYIFIGTCDNLFENIFQTVFTSKQLKKLSIYNLPFATGKLTAQIANAQNLEILILSNLPFLNGSMPAEFGQLKKLGTLQIYNCPKLKNIFPSTINTCENLLKIDIQKVDSIGKIPVTFGQLPKLRTLFIYNSNISGSLNGFSPMDSLRSLDLVRCGLKGDLTGFASNNLKELLYLNLSQNNLSGTIPKAVFELPKLNRLDFRNNQFSALETDITNNNVNLKHIFLDENKISGNIPSKWLKFQKLELLLLAKNQLSGDLPVELSLLPSIDIISLDSNLIKGPLNPTFFENIKGSITMDYNPINSPFPKLNKVNNSIATLTMSNCGITGKMLDEMYNFPNLKVLQCYKNKITGTIPKSIGTLKKLQYFHVFNNKITGVIPNELGDLPELYSILVDSNDLSGCYPKGLQKACFGIYSFLGNPQLPDFNKFCANGEGACITSNNDFLLENKVKCYPNPFQEELVIDLGNDFMESVTIEIFDFQGKKYLKQDFFNENKININTHFLSKKGIYFLKIKIRNQTIVRKMVKIDTI